MKAKYEQTKFIKLLGEVPFISYAAKKSGISRATIYRWKKENPEFKEAINKALKHGRETLVDVAEMALVEKIKAKDLGAIKFFLQHNDKRYLPMRTAFMLPTLPKINSEKQKADEPKNVHDMTLEEIDELIKKYNDEIEKAKKAKPK